MIDVILGLQWGDEGKGKIADYLTPKYDMVARFQGGPNAGHSLEFEGKKFVLNTIPSGIFRKGIVNLIGNGVVIDPIRLRDEIDRIKDECPDYKERLQISKKAHLILPTHRILDAASEAAKGKDKIGSTLRGIGPTYRDKIGRSGLRVGDVLEDDFEKRYEKIREQHLQQIAFLGFTDFDIQKEETLFFESLEFFKTLTLVNSEYLIHSYIKQGKKILAEGAQGSLLDVEFGTYPFVTSSNTLSGGVCSGLGVAPKHIRKVYGIFKAYCTRVGSGPFPTELDDTTGDYLREVGHEFGATTGRTRRTGWLDLVALKYTAMLNGVDELIMMKGDVLNGMEELKVATEYEIKGNNTQEMPANLCSTAVNPIYQSFPGWSKEISLENGYEAMDNTFKEYVDFIEKYVESEISVISMGPGRDETLVR
ncbi:MAG: adenylosuccinate synthase [Bacteroidia bacterium]|jgi:adenylosuccinate synthase|nr:adenylosuccinate synthase [Bacteroidia bacterium]MDG1748028.1 adenylosuccinate synthase [Bacteroidia bacterium]